jgi:TonB family protein
MDDATRSMIAKAGLLAAPLPEYPHQARVAELQGRGLYLVRFDSERGLAREVTVLRSTGYAILDEAVIDSLHKWRIKPHKSEEIKVPINFQLKGERLARMRGSAQISFTRHSRSFRSFLLAGACTMPSPGMAVSSSTSIHRADW